MQKIILYRKNCARGLAKRRIIPYNKCSKACEGGAAMEKIALCWLAIISATALIFTVYDKLAAKILPKHRMPEAALMWIGAFGGAFAMYVMMQLIRHKTRHKKFMIGLPLLMVLHVILAGLVIWASASGMLG